MFTTSLYSTDPMFPKAEIVSFDSFLANLFIQNNLPQILYRQMTNDGVLKGEGREVKKKLSSIILLIGLMFLIATPSTHAYSFTGTSVTYSYYKPNGIDVDITVESTGSQMKWTFDFPTDGDPGNGNMGYALVISTDQVNPKFQVHNNDGTCAAFAWGTHLYSPWDPLLGGWNGWHTSDAAWNTPVTSLPWISCSGKRNLNDNPGGIFTVTIDCCQLSDPFYWAVHFGAGGFFNYGGLSKYPDTWAPWSGDASEFEEAPCPCPPVGGVWTPINKLELLAPYIGLASIIAVAAISIVYVKNRKKKQA